MTTKKLKPNRLRALLCLMLGWMVCVAAAAQSSVTITGIVQNEKGEVLPGATVVLFNARTKFRTSVAGNEKGLFVINHIPAGGPYVLEVSYVGYESQHSIEYTFKDGDKISLALKLKETGVTSNDVVVVGYGTQKKKDVTGAVASVSGEDIATQPVTNAMQAMKGKVAGMDIFNSGNEPGSGVNIRIRGQRSVAGTSAPLVVLDGIPVMDGFNEINPADIASIEVLKDASATAIYGSRGANGVILVTTRRGAVGKTNVNYDAYYGVTSITRKLDLMNGEQFAKLRREAARTSDPQNQYPADATLFDDIALESLAKGRSTDWQDAIYHNGAKQNHQLAISGGKDKTRFAISFNYFKEKGIVDKTDFNRGSLRINLDHQISNRIRVGVSAFASKSKQNVTDNTVFDNALRLNPLGVPYDKEGNLLFRPNNDEGQRVNPLMIIKNTIDERYKTRIFASVYGEVDILRDLTYRLNVGPEAEFYKEGYFKGSFTDVNQGGNATAGVSNRSVSAVTIENILKYNKRIGQAHHIGVTLVQSSQQSITNSDFINVNKLPYEAQGYHNVGTAGEVTSVGSDYTKWLLLSYMARVNYDYKSRYMLTLTARSDGSSVFANGHKWGSFPSAALAWRIKAEPFMQSAAVISDLKLRTSYGATGNNAINPYQTFARLVKASYAYGDAGVSGFLPATIANPDLKWETTREWNVGVDFGLLNDRITGAVEYYVANTQNLLLPRSIPGSTGYTLVLQNIGATRNTGLEVSLSTLNVKTPGGFTWKTDLNFAWNKNEIVKLYGDGKDDVGNAWFLGRPINVYYDYQKVGIWQTSEAAEAAGYGSKPGQIKLADIADKGKITDVDRVILGSKTPSVIGGMTNRFTYKGAELSVVINTRQNYLLSSNWYENNNRLAGRYNNLNVDYWTPENPGNDNPRPDKSQEGVNLGSTLTYKDASFVRIKNLLLSYNLPDAWLHKATLKSVKLTVSAENPFTITSYKGQDPEFETDGTRAMYPVVKMYAIGLSASF